ncbi:MAG: hypothetical protein JWM68_3956 [Verrucomicrobiales bacterium]|nr:hypothetical protein [Verrucomicrobiales bacterium]
MKAPEKIETARLGLHRPTANDLDAIFIRYASDPEVTGAQKVQRDFRKDRQSKSAIRPVRL